LNPRARMPAVITMSEDKKRIIDLLKKNLELTKKLAVDQRVIRRLLNISLVLRIIWLIVFLAPIILAFFYLPPYLEKFYLNLQNYFQSR